LSLSCAQRAARRREMRASPGCPKPSSRGRAVTR
jgi:hypothetical protein